MKVTFAQPSSIEDILGSAFAGDDEGGCAFAEIFIPNSVRQIGEKCFYNCQNLRQITFGSPTFIQTIGVNFINRTNVAEIVIPDCVTHLSYDLFKGCENIAKVDFGPHSSLVCIERECFSESNIIEISLPRSLTKLEDRCFYGCRKLVRLSFGQSLELSIGRECFARTGLQEIYIPDIVTEIRDSCFSFCSNLSHVHFGPASKLEVIGDFAFAGQDFFYDESFCSIPLTEIHIPDSVRRLGESCFYNCLLSRVTFGSGSHLVSIGESAFSGGNEMGDGPGCPIEEFSVPETVEYINDWCFYNCYRLSSITFSPRSRLKSIGVAAFSGNISSQSRSHVEALLKGINDDLCSCGSRGYFDSDDLCSCGSRGYFDRDVESITADTDENANRGCPIREIFIPESVRVIEERCFYNCRELVRVSFVEKSQLESIGAEAFCGDIQPNGTSCSCPIAEIDIPDNVRELGDCCFCNCSQLCRVTLGLSSCLQRIGCGCITGTMVREIFIPDKVERLENRCFYNCKYLSQVIFNPTSELTWMGVEVFSGEAEGCPLTEIFIPDHVGVISDRCFCNCHQLQLVTFSQSLSIREIGADAFSGTKIDNINEIFKGHLETNQRTAS